MKFGVGLTGLTQQSEGVEITKRVDELRSTVRFIDQAGFDYVTIGQHFLTHPLQQLQTLPVLSWLIPESHRLRYVTTVVAPLTNPVYLAESVATLDVLSGGRIGLNVALGYRDVEYQAFGATRSERVGRLEALVPVLLALWEGRPVTSRTPWWTLDEARISPLPLQQPHPPVWIAANADTAIRRAARWGIPWNVNAHSTLTTIARQVEIFRKTAAAAGHDGAMPLPMARELFCAPTQEQAFELAGPYIAGKYDSYAQWGQHKVLPDHDDFRVPIGRLAAERFVIGSPDDCIEQLRSYGRLGIDQIHLRMIWPGMPLSVAMDSIRLFVAEVMPAFAN